MGHPFQGHGTEQKESNMRLTEESRRHPAPRAWTRALAAAALAVGALASLAPEAGAIPAFARKYQANCALCHTNEPRLTTFGQQFKENGYQMPGTADGDTHGKQRLEGPQGPVTLDTLSQIMAVRFRGDILHPSFREEKDAMREEGVTGQTDFSTAPTIVNLFFGGTVKANLSYFSEVEYNSQEDHFGFERVYLLFSNLGGPSRANVQVGNFDPSGLYVFPTHRQQINPIGPEADSSAFPPTINRIPVLPLAFAAKMYGLTLGKAYEGAEGYAILPFQPFLYNAPSQNGLALYGRPLGAGSPLFLQLGVSQQPRASGIGRSKRYDVYLMGRYDFTVGGAEWQVGAFYHKAPGAAVATLNMSGNMVYADRPTDLDRWGVGARVRFGDWDVYGTYVADSMDRPSFTGNMMAATSTWETSAAGLSLEADWRLHPEWMLALRYDWMSPGGLSRLPKMADPAQTQLNVDTQFIAPMIKYYPRPNIGLYARAHLNLTGDKQLPNGGPFDGSTHPASNLESVLALGVDMAF